MTDLQKRGIKSDILGIIHGIIHDTMSDAQTSLDIKNTSIKQEYEEKLAFTENELADLVTEILILQKEAW